MTRRFAVAQKCSTLTNLKITFKLSVKRLLSVIVYLTYLKSKHQNVISKQPPCQCREESLQSKRMGGFFQLQIYLHEVILRYIREADPSVISYLERQEGDTFCLFDIDKLRLCPDILVCNLKICAWL